MKFRTRDLDAAIAAVGSVYCPHELALDARARTLDTRLAVPSASGQPLVFLAYGAAVRVDAGDFPGLYLFMRCTGGSGDVGQGKARAAWRPGTTIPVSANRPTRFDFAAGFEQITVRLDGGLLEAHCARLLGRPLDKDLRFELTPFSAELDAAWRSALELARTLPASLPPAARASLEDLMLTLVLDGHRHNFSDALVTPAGAANAPRIVDLALDFMASRQGDPTLRMAAVSAAVGVSTRTLQAAFRDQRGTSPAVQLRELRLDAARRLLLAGGAGQTVTRVALEQGFLHFGRFARSYARRFGEAPAQTLRRGRRSAAGLSPGE